MFDTTTFLSKFELGAAFLFLFSTILSILTFLTAWFLMKAVVHYRHRTKEKKKEKIDRYEPLVSQTGMASPTEKYITQNMTTPLTIAEYAELHSEPEVINYVYPLPYEFLQQILRQCCIEGIQSEHSLKVRRAVTVASALYKFPIPAHFVLADATTAKIYVEFINRYEGALVEHWMKVVMSKEILLTIFTHNSKTEKEFGLSDIDYNYTQTFLLPKVAVKLLELSREVIFPDAERVAHAILTESGWSAQYAPEDRSKVTYMILATISVVSQLFMLEVPIKFLHFSPLARKLLAASRPTKSEPVKPKASSHLQLAVNNQPNTKNGIPRGKL